MKNQISEQQFPGPQLCAEHQPQRSKFLKNCKPPAWPLNSPHCGWSVGHSRGPFMALLALATFVLAANIATAGDDKPTCCSKEHVETGPISDQSLYQLESAWENDGATTLHLNSLRGRPQFLTMFFASCEYACPILVHDMKRIEAALPENIRTNIGFVLVSFDHERDTPEALTVYRRVHGLKANWTLLRGKPDDVLELGALLGIKFKKDQRGQFAHSNVITLLNAEGEIVSQQIGLNGDPVSIFTAAKNLFPVPSE